MEPDQSAHIVTASEPGNAAVTAETMRALVIRRYGGPEVMAVQDVPVPTPGPGQVRIRVHAAGLNPVDLRARDGAMRPLRFHRPPMVAGHEAAGVVESVGSGAGRFAVGDRVFTRVGHRQMGALAEYVVVDEHLVARMPESADFTAAAGLPLVGLTALQALRDELHVVPGQKVFISGGAGGVGTVAIQIAKHLGAVVATTASPRGESLVRDLGADVVVDYTSQRIEDVLHDYDAALDTVGRDTLTRTFAVLKPSGKLVSLAGPPEPVTASKDLAAGPAIRVMFRIASIAVRRRAKARQISYRYLFMHPDGAELAELAAMVDAGYLRPVVDRSFELDQVQDALAYLETGRAKGKVVVGFP